jgi:hypothetical protein
MTTRSYREFAWSRLLEVVEEAARTASTTPSLPVPRTELRARFDEAIDAVPAIAALLDRAEVTEPVGTPVVADGSEDAVDPINRADDVLAQIAGKLHEP